ncbi:flocculation protein FLO11-like [Chiloscyllium plagiosum]|uniref:flocculation protein FLO11-like n=1 Tax=Chiloscyllium plagiosum TaxID=36176 RepID=UPI001CB8242E|nr:flocculation protein FLO11-like [Chiloscyllium plagiosum]
MLHQWPTYAFLQSSSAPSVAAASICAATNGLKVEKSHPDLRGTVRDDDGMMMLLHPDSSMIQKMPKKIDLKRAAGLHFQMLLSLGINLEDLSTPVTCAVQKVEGEECAPKKEALIEEMPVQDPTPTTCVSTNQVQHKRSAETTNSEISSKRRLKERLLHTPATGCTGLINGRPVSKRISTGHFSAWGVEDDEVLYYMQKDSQSADPVSVPTPYQEASLQNHNNCANQIDSYTISPFRATQTSKKCKHFATWMRSNSKTSPKTLLYSHFSKSPVSLPKGSSNCDENDSPNSKETWICDTCLITNKAPAVRCRGCEVLKCGLPLQREWIPDADVSLSTNFKGIQKNEMSTQTQRRTYICKVESNRTTTPQITSSAAEMFTCSPSFTTSSQMTDAMCFVTKMDPSRDSSDGSPDEILPTGTASPNIPSPTGINPSTCLLPVSPGTGLDETVPSGSWKLSDSVEEHRDSQVQEISTQTQRSTNKNRVESSAVETPQIICSIIEVSICSPILTTSQIPCAICSVTQTDPSSDSWSDSSNVSIHEPLSTSTESANTPLPTEINTSTCSLSASSGTELDEIVPSGSWNQWDSAEEYKDSQVQDKTVATMSYWIQDPPISITFPRIFDPPVYATSDSAVLSMINMPPSSRSDMNTTVVSTTPFQAPPFVVGCSNETGNNNFNSGMDGSSLNFLPVFGQARNTEVANAYLTENPSPYQSTEAGFHFPSNLVPNCTFGHPTNNVFQFGANNTNQSTFQESFSFAPNSSTWAPTLPNAAQSSCYSHRKIKTAVYRRR